MGTQQSHALTNLYGKGLYKRLGMNTLSEFRGHYMSSQPVKPSSWGVGLRNLLHETIPHWLATCA